MLCFGFSVLGSVCSWAQYQVSTDLWYNKINADTFVLQTQYPYVGSIGSSNRKVIEIASGWFDDGTRVQVYNPYASNGSVSGLVQEWHFIPAGRIEGEMSYYIINRWHRRYMQASAMNGQVRALAFNGQLNQRWFFDSGFLNKRFLRSASSGLYLSFPSSNIGSGVTMLPLNLGTSQQIDVSTLVSADPVRGLNWNYLKPTIIHLADNPNLVFGDSAQSSSSTQNQVITLQNRVYGPTYQTWEPHSETWLQGNGSPVYSNLPGDDGIRFVRRWTSFVMAPWNNMGSTGYGITTRFWEPNPGEQQRWYVVSSRTPGRFTMVHAASGLTLQPQFNGPGALLVLVPFNTDSSQQVTFENLP